MIWEQFLSRVRQAPDSRAICVRDRFISYSELAGMAAALASQYFVGQRNRPERALIQQSDPFAILLCILACWHSRVVPMVMRENASRTQLHEVAALFRPAHVMHEQVSTDLLTPLDSFAGDRAPWDRRSEALVLNTSGTTGSPKLVALPAESVCINATVIGASLGLTAKDRIAVTTPLTYMYGLMGGTTAGLFAGATVHLFSPQLPLTLAQAGIRKHDITVFQAPPTTINLFKSYWTGRPFSSVRMVSTGGEALTPELVGNLTEIFPRAKKIFLYGMTEAGPRISHDDIDAGRFAEGCAGIPYPHVEWRIDPVSDADVPAPIGRLALRGPGIFLGYLQPDGSYAGLEDDGFFLTNDLVLKDDCGRICFYGRLDRMFKCGGKLVNPTAVERILNRHPGVQQSLCRAEPHALLGFAPVAEAVLKPGHQTTESELKKHCEFHLDLHAVPRRIQIVSHLPVSHSGKTSASNS